MLVVSVVVAGICVPTAIASTLALELFDAERGQPNHTVTVNCGPTETSPFTYHAEGTATGPHPGTFVEDGRVVLAPLPPPNEAGTLADLDATFTIMSSTGNVTGEKHLLAPVATDLGICGGSDSAALLSESGQVCYRARFGGGITEEGRSQLVLVIFEIDNVFFKFSEDFVPDPTVSCGGGGEEKVTICHRPPGNPGNAHTIQVGASAIAHHLGHGDTPGPCLP